MAEHQVDRTRLLAVFDETADAVFGVCCRLSAGDRVSAMWLASRAFSDAAGGIAVDGGDSGPPLVDAIGLAEVVDAVHLAVLADVLLASGDVQPIASLSPRDRVLLSLTGPERRDPSTIAGLLGTSGQDLTTEIAAATKRFEALADGEPLDRAFARCGVWFDDRMRTDLRSAVSSGSDVAGLRSGSSSGSRSDGSGLVNAIGAPGWRPPEDDTPDPFGATEDFVRPAGSKWAIIGVGLAVIAAIAAATVWVLPSNDEQATPPATFVIAPTTSTVPVAPPPTEPTATTDFTYSVDTGDGPPGYVFDPVPAGFEARSVYSAGTDVAPDENWFQAWKTPDATRSTGRWLVLNISTDYGDGLSMSRPGTVRMQLGGVGALVATDDAGVTSLISTIFGDTQLDLQSHGLTLDELGVVLAGVGADSSDGHYPRYTDDAAAVLDTMDLLVSKPTNASLVLAEVLASGANAYYVRDESDQTAGSIGISVGPTRPHDLDIAALLSDGVQTVADATSGLHTADGFLVTATLGDGVGFAFDYAQWHDGSETIVVISKDSGTEPLTLAASVRPADDDEWQAASLAASQQLQASLQYQVPNGFTVVGSGTTADDQQYSIGLADSVEEGRKELWWNADITDVGHDGDGSAGVTTLLTEPDPTRPLLQFDSATLTVLVAVFRATPTFESLRITVQGNEPVDVPVMPVGTNLWAAAFAYSEPQPYVAELVDVDGTVVTTLTNP